KTVLSVTPKTLSNRYSSSTEPPKLQSYLSERVPTGRPISGPTERLNFEVSEVCACKLKIREDAKTNATVLIFFKVFISYFFKCLNKYYSVITGTKLINLWPFLLTISSSKMTRTLYA